MKKISILVITLLLLISFSKADALTIFYDDFDSENGGVTVLNYNSFINWDVTGGTVDYLFNYFSGLTGGYIDMDGSTSNAGKMTTKNSYGLLPGEYTLQFDLAGNQRSLVGDTIYVQVDVGNLLNKSYSLFYTHPFETFSETFSVNEFTEVSLSFEGYGGDNIGMLLDNVILSGNPVPEPTTMLLLGTGLIGLAGVRRKFKK